MRWLRQPPPGARGRGERRHGRDGSRHDPRRRQRHDAVRLHRRQHGEPTCVEGCADAWPPTLLEGEPEVGDLDASVFTVVEHPLGSQLKAGDWPLYTFSGDTAPGDTNGQGSGGKWFVVAVDGTLIES